MNTLDPVGVRVFLSARLHQERDETTDVTGKTAAAAELTAVSQTEATPPCPLEDEDEDEDEAPAEVM